jgi:hypothetical protein
LRRELKPDGFVFAWKKPLVRKCMTKTPWLILLVGRPSAAIWIAGLANAPEPMLMPFPMQSVSGSPAQRPHAHDGEHDLGYAIAIEQDAIPVCTRSGEQARLRPRFSGY